jgi:hypothetical protein
MDRLLVVSGKPVMPNSPIVPSLTGQLRPVYQCAPAIAFERFSGEKGIPPLVAEMPMK